MKVAICIDIIAYTHTRVLHIYKIQWVYMYLYIYVCLFKVLYDLTWETRGVSEVIVFSL